MTGPFENISARATLEVGGYVSAAERARQATARWGTDVERAAGATRSWESSMRSASMVLTGLGAAAGGFAFSLAKTGSAFNTLQAQSSKAFATIMGDARAARRFMDDLFDFTSASPFDRGIFLTGAQELTAVGVAGERTIRIFGALQDAIAGAGRSDADLADVISVIAKIESEGKITARTLQELALRVPDAAGLMGDALGMTGAQIRESITEGTLGASEAIDALVAGASAKFGGMAAEVKELLPGAMQSVRARLRNLGSDLMEPFVGSEGGGALVEFVSAVADSLSALRAVGVPELEGPIQGAADALSRFADATRDALSSLDAEDVSGIIDLLGSIAPLAAGGAGAISVLGGQALPIVGNLLKHINPLAAGLVTAAATSSEFRSAAFDLAQALGTVLAAAAPLTASVGDLMAVLAGDVAAPAVSALADALGGLAAAIGLLSAPLAGIIDVFTWVIEHVPIVSELLGVMLVTRLVALRATALATATGLGKATSAVNGLGRAANALAPAIGIAMVGLGEISRRLDEIGQRKVTEVLTGLDLTRLDDEAEALKRLHAERDRLNDTGTRIAGSFSFYGSAKAEIEALDRQIAELEGNASQRSQRIGRHAREMADEFGVSRDVIVDLFKDADGDALGLAESVDEVRRRTEEMLTAAGLWAPEMDRATTSAERALAAVGMFGPAWDEAREAAAKYAAEVEGAVISFGGLLDAFDAGAFAADQDSALKARESALRDVERAQDRVTESARKLEDAQRDLARTDEDLAVAAVITPADLRRREDAQRKVADAQRDLARAAQEAAEAEAEASRVRAERVLSDNERIRQQQEQRLAQARRYSAAIKAAIESGLDPAFIREAIAAGPAAADALEVIVADPDLVQVVNNVEAEIRAIAQDSAATGEALDLAFQLGIEGAGDLNDVLAFTKSLLAEDLVAASNIARESLSGLGDDVAKALAAAAPGIQQLSQVTSRAVSGALGRIWPFADGGIVAYAHGGIREHHVAQIAPAGAWRVWAEPETGGEAYIPLALAKRARSEAILGEVARRFGYQLTPMAAGGILGTTSGPVTNTTHIDRSERHSRVYRVEGPIIASDPAALARELEKRERLAALTGG